MSSASAGNKCPQITLPGNQKDPDAALDSRKVHISVLTQSAGGELSGSLLGRAVVAIVNNPLPLGSCLRDGDPMPAPLVVGGFVPFTGIAEEGLVQTGIKQTQQVLLLRSSTHFFPLNQLFVVPLQWR